MFDNTAFLRSNTEFVNAFTRLTTPLKLASSAKEVNQVVNFIAAQYQKSFPEIQPHQSSDYITNSFNFYTEDEQGNIDGTISLMLDTEQGFPDEHAYAAAIAPYREAEKILLQAGRFVVSPGKDLEKRAMTLLQTLYLVPKLLGAAAVIGMVRPKDLSLHQKRFGAKLLMADIGKTYGSDHQFALVAWEPDALTDNYFKKTACPRLSDKPKPPYHNRQWDQYANAFGSIQTQFQRELQLAACRLLFGDVADFGCGAAKLAALLSDDPKVQSYTGIDYSKQMLANAEQILRRLAKPSFRLWQGKIEHYVERQFDSAVSLNSFYSWPDPQRVLSHIAQTLKPQGILVLATPNREIAKQMPNMLSEAEKELMLHPAWQQFKQQNLEFVQNPDAHFIEMDNIINQAHAAGFAVESCHQHFYLGALNFLVLKKKVTPRRQIAA